MSDSPAMTLLGVGSPGSRCPGSGVRGGSWEFSLRVLWGRIGSCDLTLWMKPSSKRPRFPGLRLSARDRQFLADQTREGRAVSARTWKRIRILELLHERWTPRRRRRSGGDVPAGSPARRLALSRARRAGRFDGRSPAEAGKTPRYASTSGDCRDGLWTAAPGVCALDDSRDHGGDPTARDCRRRGPRDRAASAGPPRAEAVAEKKCGASRRSTLTTSTAWRTC